VYKRQQLRQMGDLTMVILSKTLLQGHWSKTGSM